MKTEFFLVILLILFLHTSSKLRTSQMSDFCPTGFNCVVSKSKGKYLSDELKTGEDYYLYHKGMLGSPWPLPNIYTKTRTVTFVDGSTATIPYWTGSEKSLCNNFCSQAQNWLKNTISGKYKSFDCDYSKKDIQTILGPDSIYNC